MPPACGPMSARTVSARRCWSVSFIGRRPRPRIRQLGTEVEAMLLSSEERKHPTAIRNRCVQWLRSSFVIGKAVRARPCSRGCRPAPYRSQPICVSDTKPPLNAMATSTALPMTVMFPSRQLLAFLSCQFCPAAALLPPCSRHTVMGQLRRFSRKRGRCRRMPRRVGDAPSSP